MTRADLLAFLRRHRLAVQASVSPDGAPQAAVVGYAVTEDFEIIFDTLSTSRKWENLHRNHRIALVIGWDEEQTVQYEGVADRPFGAELDALQQAYFAVFPDGPSRLRWPGITYVRARPTWIRYSDFRTPEPRIVEFSAAELRRPRS
jgi:pyridoxamine 5'-phosphate oxidase-like protein